MSLENYERFSEIFKNISELRNVPDPLFEEWQVKISDHLAQVGNLRKLDTISKLIRAGGALPVRRINFNVKKLSEDNEECKSRWQALEKLDCPSIIFCTLSLPGLMSLPLDQFDWLVQYVQGYVEEQKFSPSWIGRDQIRKALASTPRRQSTQSFLQRYHDLEIKMIEGLSSDIPDGPEDEHREVEVEQSSATNTHLEVLAKKRQRTEEAELLTGEPQPTRLVTVQSHRPEIEFAFSQAPIQNLPLLRDLILKGIENSQLYADERQRQEPRTGCITVFIRPRNTDGSIIITTGSRTCHEMRHTLGLNRLNLEELES